MKICLVFLHLAVAEEGILIVEGNMVEAAGMLVDLEKAVHFHRVVAKNGLTP